MKCHPVPQSRQQPLVGGEVLSELQCEGAVAPAASTVKLRSPLLMLLCYLLMGPSQVSGVALIAEDGGGAYLYTRWEN